MASDDRPGGADDSRRRTPTSGILRRFAVAAAIVFVIVGVLLYLLLYKTAVDQADARSRTYAELASAAVAGSGVIKPDYLATGFPPTELPSLMRLQSALDLRKLGWEAVRIIASDGTVVLATDPNLTWGTKVGLTGAEHKALESPNGHQEVVDADRLAMGGVSSGEKLVTMVPFTLGGRTVGVFELVEPRTAQTGPANQSALVQVGLIGGAFLILYLAMLPIVARADRIANQQIRRDEELLAAERETVRRLEQLDRAKDDLLAFSAHEFRTPLTSLLGFAQTLEARRRDLSDDQIGDYLNTIVRQARRMQRIANDVLDVAAIEAGRMDVTIATVGAGSVARDVAQEFIDDNVVCFVDTEVAVAADRGRLEQVLTNLIRNAIQHGPAGGRVVLRTSVATPEMIEAAGLPPVDGSRSMVAFDVTDEGTGLDATGAEKLFDKFERGSGRGLGSGLGLYIGRRFVEAQRGRLNVVAGAPTTTFRVLLPAAQLPALDPPRPKPAAASAGFAPNLSPTVTPQGVAPMPATSRPALPASARPGGAGAPPTDEAVRSDRRSESE